MIVPVDDTAAGADRRGVHRPFQVSVGNFLMSTLMKCALACLGAKELPGDVLSDGFRHGRVSIDVVEEIDEWDLLNKVAIDTDLTSPQLRIISNSTDIIEHEYRTRSVRDGIPINEFDPAVLERLRHTGGTIVVNGVDRLDRRVRYARETLEYAVGERCWTNLYATWGTEAGFGPHADARDAIIVQLSGRKRWRVANHRHPDPSVGLAGPTFDEVLDVGDVLHIPRGWAHNVAGVGAFSVHLTFVFQRTRWADIVAAALDAETDRTVLGEVPRPHASGQAVEQVIGAVSASVSADSFRRERAMRPERRAGLSMPWSVGADTASAEFVRWASIFPPIVTYEQSYCLVESMGGSYKLDVALRGLMEILATGERVRTTDLCPRTSLSTEELSDVLSFLLTNGLVILE